MIEDLAQEYAVDWLCQLFGLPRSTYYYQPTRTADDPELVQAIEALLADKPYLGYRMVVARLKQVSAGIRAHTLCWPPGHDR